MGLEPTTSTLRIRHATECATPSLARLIMLAGGLYYLVRILFSKISVLTFIAMYNNYTSKLVQNHVHATLNCYYIELVTFLCTITCKSIIRDQQVKYSLRTVINLIC